MKSNYYIALFSLLLFSFFTSCDNSDKTLLGNDCIKRSISPNIVGGEIEFAYAMAIPPQYGHLEKVEVWASIAGAEGTYLNPNSYYTNSNGADIGVPVADESRLEGNSCITSFVKDTCAATLRYFYKIPETARNQEVSFRFSVTASNGEIQSYSMGPYKISKMDIIKGLLLTTGDKCYLSIADMKVYSESEISSTPNLASRVDLMFGTSTNPIIGAGLFAPSAPEEYKSGIVATPVGAVADTKIVKAWGVRDQQLSDLQWAVFVDDVDLISFSFEQATNFTLQLKAENGIWVETADGKYRAYLFINKIENNQMTIGMKRYAF